MRHLGALNMAFSYGEGVYSYSACFFPHLFILHPMTTCCLRAPTGLSDTPRYVPTHNSLYPARRDAPRCVRRGERYSPTQTLTIGLHSACGHTTIRWPMFLQPKCLVLIGKKVTFARRRRWGVNVCAHVLDFASILPSHTSIIIATFVMDLLT